MLSAKQVATKWVDLVDASDEQIVELFGFRHGAGNTDDGYARSAPPGNLGMGNLSR